MASLPWYLKAKYVGVKDNRVIFNIKIDKRYIFLKYLEFFLTEYIPEKFF